MQQLFFTIIGIWFFTKLYDQYAEYQGHKDEMQHRKDYFETYGKRLKRNNKKNIK